MTDNVIGAVIMLGFMLPMLTLAWAALQPTRRSVWSAVSCLALLPAAFLVLALVVWAIGR